jgi:hypothetical protein
LTRSKLAPSATPRSAAATVALPQAPAGTLLFDNLSGALSAPADAADYSEPWLVDPALTPVGGSIAW